jgi:hypothetical protein
MTPWTSYLCYRNFQGLFAEALILSAIFIIVPIVDVAEFKEATSTLGSPASNRHAISHSKHMLFLCILDVLTLLAGSFFRQT